MVAPNFDTRSDPEEDHNVLPSYLLTKSIDCTAAHQLTSGTLGGMTNLCGNLHPLR